MPSQSFTEQCDHQYHVIPDSFITLQRTSYLLVFLPVISSSNHLATTNNTNLISVFMNLPILDIGNLYVWTFVCGSFGFTYFMYLSFRIFKILHECCFSFSFVRLFFFCFIFHYGYITLIYFVWCWIFNPGLHIYKVYIYVFDFIWKICHSYLVILSGGDSTGGKVLPFLCLPTHMPSI